MSRRTDIVDDELKEEVFTKLSSGLIEEKRLLQRFHTFCEEYTEFEYDEMGINMEDAEDILRKTNKICTLLLSNIEENLSYTFNDIKMNTREKYITFNLNIENTHFKVKIKINQNNFELELLEG